MPVRQWGLSFPIPLRILFAGHPQLLAPVLRIIHRVIANSLIKQPMSIRITLSVRFLERSLSPSGRNRQFSFFGSGRSNPKRR
jgi:hypothetical protein